MKTKVLTGLLFFLSFISYSQSKNQTDENGLKQGAWVRYIQGSDKLIYKGNFKDDVPVGHWDYFYDNQIVRATIDYTEKGIFAKIFHTNGVIMGEGAYVKNSSKDDENPYLKNGLWSFYDFNATLSSKENFKNGIKSGSSKVFYLSGNLASEYFYVNGIKQGEFIEYFDNGTLKSKGFIKDGNYEGEYVVYKSNEEIYMKGSYKNGVKHGEWIILDEDDNYQTYIFKYGEIQK